MVILIVGLILILLFDQVFKSFVSHRLEGRSISLGLIGEVRGVQQPIWIARSRHGQKLTIIWSCWIVAAFTLALVSTVIPLIGCFSLLLLGGSLSHAVETTLRGSVCDYVCLRFWPAFNLADVAIAIGAIGLGIRVLILSIG